MLNLEVRFRKSILTHNTYHKRLSFFQSGRRYYFLQYKSPYHFVCRLSSSYNLQWIFHPTFMQQTAQYEKERGCRVTGQGASAGKINVDRKSEDVQNIEICFTCFEWFNTIRFRSFQPHFFFISFPYLITATSKAKLCEIDLTDCWRWVFFATVSNI